MRFGAYTAVEHVDLELQAGEFVGLVGPTGCGKSTLLNVITGLAKPSAGSVTIFGEPLTDINDKAGYMLQQDGLLPWKTTLDNVAIGLIFQGINPRDARERAQPWLQRVGLGRFGDRYPHQLSGGMKKRTAMAQMLILHPQIALMDEPFSALDVQTRHLMQNELLGLWQDQKMAVLFITHDLEEAITLSDRVVVMSAGPAGRPIASFPIDLPRPRDVTETVLTSEYRQIYGKIWNVLRDEVRRTHERSD